MLWRKKGLQLLIAGMPSGLSRFSLPPRKSRSAGFQLITVCPRNAAGGSDLVEIGCGVRRSALSCPRMRPRRLIATMPRTSDSGDRRRQNPPNLEFRAAPACRLPLQRSPATWSSALKRFIPNRTRARCLPRQPGCCGREAICLSRLFYTRDSSPNAVSLFRSCVSCSPFERWWRTIGPPKLWRPWRKIHRGGLRDRPAAAVHAAGCAFVCCTVRSPLYASFETPGRYLHFCLVKPPATLRADQRCRC